MAMIQLMLGAVIDSTHTIEPDAWRRYLGIVLDGLRTRRSTPTSPRRRESASPLSSART
jgi:hypothetical protein